MPSFSAYSCSHKVISAYDCRVKLARQNGISLTTLLCAVAAQRRFAQVTGNAIKIFEKTQKIITIEKIQNDMITARGTEISAKFPPIFRRTCWYKQATS
jgi:hypothetical protein